MATSSDQLSPALSTGDQEGLSGDEAQPEVYHDSNSNWLEIQEVKERLSKIEAFDQEIHKLPLMNKEAKEQKERTTKVEENLGRVDQKVIDMEDYIKIIEKLETQSLQNMEMQLNLSTVVGKMEHSNQGMDVNIKGLEDKEQRSNQEMGNQRRAPH